MTYQRTRLDYSSCRLNNPPLSSKINLVSKDVEICKNRTDARELEKYFKSGYGREILKEIIDSSRGDGMADMKVSKTFEL